MRSAINPESTNPRVFSQLEMGSQIGRCSLLWLVMLLTGGLTCTAQARDTSITVHAHPTSPQLDEFVYLTVRAQAPHALSLKVPVLSGWAVMSQTRTTSETRRNRKRIFTRTIDFVLKSKASGSIKVGAF